MSLKTLAAWGQIFSKQYLLLLDCNLHHSLFPCTNSSVCTCCITVKCRQETSMQQSHLTSGFQSPFILLKLIKWIVLQTDNHTTVLFNKTNKEEPSCICFIRKICLLLFRECILWWLSYNINFYAVLRIEILEFLAVSFLHWWQVNVE